VLIGICAACSIGRSIAFGYDTLIVTALGDRNALAAACDLQILKITANGRDMDISPVNGTWFWQGDGYIWRNEQDPNRPKDVTRKIEFRLPVGSANMRSVTFVRDFWGGMLEISLNDANGDLLDARPIDTYSENYNVYECFLPESGKKALFKEQIFGIAASVICFVVVTTAMFFVTRLLFRKRDKIFQLSKHNWETLSICLISFAVFIELFSVSDKICFWSDELFTLLTALQPNINDFVNITIGDSGAPLGNFLLFFWYKLAPYGERYLLILPNIAAALTVYHTGKLGKTAVNTGGGVLAAILAATTLNVLIFGNYLRIYAFAMLLMAINARFFYNHLKNPNEETLRNILVRGSWLALLVYSNYPSVFICLFMFIEDLVLMVRKKVHPKSVLSYVFAGILFVPWLIGMIVKRNGLDMFIIGWTPLPNRVSLLSVITTAFSANSVYAFLFMLGVAVLIYNCVANKDIGVLGCGADVCLALSTFTPAAAYIALSFIMNRFLGFHFWYDRYIVFMIPLFVVVAAYGLYGMIGLLSANAQTLRCVLCVSIALLLFFGGNSYISIIQNPMYAPYFHTTKASSDWLMQQPDIYAATTGIALVGSYPEAYFKYYIEKQGRRQTPNCIYNIGEMGPYDTVYTYEQHVALTEGEKTAYFSEFDCVYQDANTGIKKWVRR
jgi:hypothetical protein